MPVNLVRLSLQLMMCYSFYYYKERDPRRNQKINKHQSIFRSIISLCDHILIDSEKHLKNLVTRLNMHVEVVY